MDFKDFLRSICPILIILMTSSCLFKPPVFDEIKWRQEIESQDPEKLKANHFKNGIFFNPWSERRHGGFIRFLKWKLSFKQTYSEEEKNFLPKFIPNLKERIKSFGTGDFITWIGHATFLLRIDEKYFLTDPMFSDRALIVKRKIPPAITGNEIGEFAKDLTVLISHNHYDHLDEKSIKDLPDHTRFIVPLGLKKFVEDVNKKNVIEVDWWQEVEIREGIKIICLPAQHWSRRIGQPVNSTLWASYLIVSPGLTVYYAGDSGYFVGYKVIGSMFPDIDYALMPTTAYQPRWFMYYAHMDIKETIDAFKDLSAKFFIPTQWGTFWLGDDPPGYPIIELKRKIKEMDLDKSKFIIMDVGEIKPLRGKNNPQKE
ncbi:MAG: MBL fold metallo-hydrolase [Syntrophorhabdaceae bacterium]|nr:MBL fold metallo-hydrolase [Syntrophorhabdaceae bacterium]